MPSLPLVNHCMVIWLVILHLHYFHRNYYETRVKQ